MKLPFDFGPKLVFRLGIPGMILATATAPLVFNFAQATGTEVDRLEVIAIGTVFWGWAISLADMPIYMLYEGRRFWPGLVRGWFMNRERARLDRRLKGSTNQARTADERTYLENSVDLLNFPLNRDTGKAEVRFPTRLGNLITAYESYPRINYGLDAIFFWPRLWTALDKDLREEIDNQQAIADSSIYTSFALWVAALICLFYACMRVVFHLQFSGVPKPFGLLLLANGIALAAFLVYRVSLFAHAQFGELFKAVFDQHRKKLDIDSVVEKVGVITGDLDASNRSEAERYQMVSRYLRWHRIRPTGEEKNFSPEDWIAEKKRREDAYNAS